MDDEESGDGDAVCSCVIDGCVLWLRGIRSNLGEEERVCIVLSLLGMF